jgi:hypothetical protein
MVNDSWVNLISRLNHSCSCSNGVIGLAVVIGFVAVAVVIGFVAVVIGFVAVVIGFVAVVALRLTTLAQDIG